jgi:hypothetical protein
MKNEMERVKDLSKLKLCLGSVLIKIHMKDSKILSTTTNNSALADYAEVTAISADITDLNIGDIVLDFRSNEGFKWNNEHYALIPRMNIKIASDKDNIDLFKDKKVNLKKLN